MNRVQSSLLLTIILLSLSNIAFAKIGFGISQQDSLLNKYVMAGPSSIIDKIIPYDINQDGNTDLVYRLLVHGDTPQIITTKINVLPGLVQGFDTTGIVTLAEDRYLDNFFLGDWDGDSNVDLITQNSTTKDGVGYNSDLIRVSFLNKLESIDSTSFYVPYEIYMGNKTNPKSLQQLADIDLDGKVDMVLTGFSHVTIGWNEGEGEPMFDELTNSGYNTYSTQVLDVNQDGYPDLIHDDQSTMNPVLLMNNKNRSFTKKVSGLPAWKDYTPEGMYAAFETFWLNDDIHPDLLVTRFDEEAIASVFELYEYNSKSDKFSKSALQFTKSEYGQVRPFHFNNDGFVDFVYLSFGSLSVLMNESNTDFTTFEIDVPNSSVLVNLFKFDEDKDDDIDVFFTFNKNDTLYQFENTEEIINEIPTTSTIDSIEVQESGVNLSWVESEDEESLFGHINYELTLYSADKLVKINLHENNVALQNLEAGDYTIEITAKDQLEGKSTITEKYSFTILPTSKEVKSNLPNQTRLLHNYPNPFNPSTIISFQLAKSSLVNLDVYDLAGRKVASLVSNEVKSAGAHKITFNAANLSSGLYFYRLKTDGETFTQKMILLK